MLVHLWLLGMTVTLTVTSCCGSRMRLPYGATVLGRIYSVQIKRSHLCSFEQLHQKALCSNLISSTSTAVMEPMYAGDSLPSAAQLTGSEVADYDVETEDEAGDYQQDVHAGRSAARSQATSPSASAPSDGAAFAGGDESYARLTARQRARLEKEAGIAEDVAWSEMELLPNLTYTWKGKGIKAPGQMTEEEWLKRQEGLERRRMRSLRDKREAEEAVKAKIRRAVTARFRGKLGPGGDSGMDGLGDAGSYQEGTTLKPGWVRMQSTADGTKVAWHPAAHPLSLPIPVTASPSSEPIELPLQAVDLSVPWRVPASSTSSFKTGSILTLCRAGSHLSTHKTGISTQQPQGDARQQPGQQQESILCIDSHGWRVGCLQQQDVQDAMELAGFMQPLQHDIHQTPGHGNGLAPGSLGTHEVDWDQWRAVVRSIRGGQDGLAAVIVRLTPQNQ